MRIRVALAMFVLLSFCSVASMKPAAGIQQTYGGGGLPTPCVPPTVCTISK